MTALTRFRQSVLGSQWNRSIKKRMGGELVWALGAACVEVKGNNGQITCDRGVAGEGEDDRTNISGSDYVVEASIGHIMDLPKNDIGVELKQRTFEPTLIVSPGKEKIVDRLKKLAAKSGQRVPGAGPGP